MKIYNTTATFIASTILNQNVRITDLNDFQIYQDQIINVFVNVCECPDSTLE